MKLRIEKIFHYFSCVSREEYEREERRTEYYKNRYYVYKYGSEKEKMKNKTIEYLKERLEKAVMEIELLSKQIRELEVSTKLDVRVVVETKGFEERDWRRMVLSKHELTLEQRDKLIGNLAWLRNV